jgi:hypothetical protein
VTGKSNITSDGTVWEQYFTGGNLYYASRFCSGGAGHYGLRLASDNVPGHQWFIGSQAPGEYEAISLNVP